jgi:hypothetical protein
VAGELVGRPDGLNPEALIAIHNAHTASAAMAKGNVRLSSPKNRCSTGTRLAPARK